MTETSLHSRTTACISEAFGFLKSTEYADPFDIDGTSLNGEDGHNVIENGEQGFTIVTYVEKDKNMKNEEDTNSRSDSGFIQENGFNEETVDPFTIVTCIEPGTENKENIQTESSDNENLANCSGYQSSDGEVSKSLPSLSGTERENVVLRKWPDNSRLNQSLSKSENGTESTSSENLDSIDQVVMRKKSNRPSRRTEEVVSDAFGFLKDLDDGSHGSYRESGVKNDGSEDRLFNKLSLIRESDINPSVGQQNSVSDSLKSHDSRNSSQGSSSRKASLKKQQNLSDTSGENSDDSSDEDTGIYNESFRNSVWMCVADNHGNNKPHILSPTIAEEAEDEVFDQSVVQSTFEKTHKRSDSTSTTKSESEFKREYRLRRKCLVQRHDSQQEYHRMSAKFYDREKVLVIIKENSDTDFGLHIIDNHPAIITEVDQGSPAYRAGAKAGQIIISINGVNVLESSHEEIVQLIQKDPNLVKIEVASSDVYHIRDLQTPVITGYMHKLSNSTFVKNWRRRFFVLRFDNCLYYYKGEQEQDPLGAIPLLNYMVSRHTETNKVNCFKAEKFGARTYFFFTDTREDMTRWVCAMNEASSRAKKKKDAWMDVTTCNVGLPALDIRKPDCSGYLSKCGRTMKTWKRRYCLLKDACIYYYKNINSQSAQGMAHLHGYTIDRSGTTLKKNSFTLRPPETQMRTFSFCAENETDKLSYMMVSSFYWWKREPGYNVPWKRPPTFHKWTDALQKSIQRWVKVD